MALQEFLKLDNLSEWQVVDALIGGETETRDKMGFILSSRVCPPWWRAIFITPTGIYLTVDANTRAKAIVGAAKRVMSYYEELRREAICASRRVMETARALSLPLVASGSREEIPSIDM